LAHSTGHLGLMIDDRVAGHRQVGLRCLGNLRVGQIRRWSESRDPSQNQVSDDAVRRNRSRQACGYRPMRPAGERCARPGGHSPAMLRRPPGDPAVAASPPRPDNAR
jgi:hypothetical protein